MMDGLKPKEEKFNGLMLYFYKVKGVRDEEFGMTGRVPVPEMPPVIRFYRP
jgi:hypothetical protein